jgi:hypothetical protein
VRKPWTGARRGVISLTLTGLGASWASRYEVCVLTNRSGTVGVDLKPDATQELRVDGDDDRARRHEHGTDRGR